MVEFYKVTDYIRPGAIVLTSLAPSNQASVWPYNISFDLKASKEPAVVTNINSSTDSIYNAVSIMLNNKTVASVGIVSYKGLQDAGIHDTWVRKALMNVLVKAEEIQDPLHTDRTIDGNRSLVQSYFDPQPNSKITVASYWKDCRVAKGSGIPVGNKTKVEILSNLPKDVNGNLPRSLAIKVPQQVLNASNVPAPLATAASAPTHPSPGSSTKAARSQMTNPKFQSSKKVTLDATVESGNRVIDRGLYEEL